MKNKIFLVICVLLSFSFNSFGGKDRTNAPKYVNEFFELYDKYGDTTYNLREYKFNNSIYQILSLYENILSLEEIKELSEYLKSEQVGEQVLSDFQNLVSQNSSFNSQQDVAIFILSYFLGHSEAIEIAKTKISEVMANKDSWIDPNMSLFAFVVIDSGEDIENGLDFFRYIWQQTNLNNTFYNFGTALPFMLPLKNDDINIILDEVFNFFINQNSPNNFDSQIFIIGQFYNSDKYQNQVIEFFNNILDNPVEIFNESSSVKLLRVLMQSIKIARPWAIMTLQERFLLSDEISEDKKLEILFSIPNQIISESINIEETILSIWYSLKERNSDNDTKLDFLIDVTRHIQYLPIDESVINLINEHLFAMFARVLSMPEEKRWQGDNLLNNILLLINSKENKELAHKFFDILINLELKNTNLFLGHFHDWQNFLSLIELERNTFLNTIIHNGKNLPSIMLKLIEAIFKYDEENKKNDFLISIFRSDEVNDNIKSLMGIELLKKIKYNFALQRRIKENEILNFLKQSLDSDIDPYIQIKIIETLLSKESINKSPNLLGKLADIFHSTDDEQQKRDLFSSVTYKGIDTSLVEFKSMAEYFINKALDITIPVNERQSIINILQGATYEGELEIVYLLQSLINLENNILVNEFNIYNKEGSEFSTHSSTAIERLKFILSQIIERIGFAEYSKEEILLKAKTILEDDDLMRDALFSFLGEDYINYVSQAKNSLGILDSAWDEQNEEMKNTNFNGVNISSVGQTFSLFINYIETQQGNSNYLPLIAGLVQALSSSDAMNGCKSGAMSQMGNSIFKEEFRMVENMARNYQDYQLAVAKKIKQIKTIAIHLLAANNFSMSNQLLQKYFPLASHPNVAQVINIFSTINFVNIFPNNENIEDLFIRRDMNFVDLLSEEDLLLTKVDNLIVYPLILALMADEYKDMVSFREYKEKGKVKFNNLIEWMDFNYPYNNANNPAVIAEEDLILTFKQ